MESAEICDDVENNDVETSDAEPKIKCLKCEKTLTTTRNLKKHIKRFHEAGTLQCDSCSKYFKSDTDLIKHKYIHTRRPCDWCEKTFASAGSLRTHRWKIHRSLMEAKNMERVDNVTANDN